MKVYLASPFFSDEQIARIEKVEAALRANTTLDEFFSPREHQHPEFEFGTKEWAKATYEGDIEALTAADAVVAIHDFTDGNVDSGTAMEIGYAIKSGKPVILFQEKKETVNIMLAVPAHAYITEFDDIKNYDFKSMPTSEYTGELI